MARLKKLEVLSLSWQKLSREDLQGMAKLKQLKTIVLNGVPLPEATMAQLKQLGTPSPWDSIAGLERARLSEAKKTDQVALSVAKRSRNRVYVVCGVVMVICFLWIGGLKWHAKEARIVVPEAGAVMAFAIAWLTKGQAILPDPD